MNSKRIPELDGIRALAILAVFAVHFFAGGATQDAGAKLHGAARGLYLVAAHGWLGVDLFFVLSGFLITGILLDSRDRPSYFHDFWVRRALRILPLVVAVVAILTIIYRPHWLYVLMALFFAVDFAPLVGLGNNAMGPMWSLAVEEQFYLVWPFLVYFLPRRALALTAGAIVVAEPILRATLGGELDMVWFRVDGLALGALVAIYVRSRFFTRTRTLRASAIVVVGAAVLLAADVHSRTSSLALRITEANLAFAALVATAVALAGSRWLAPLRSPVATFIANTSFCAYLIHIPLLDLARTLGAGAGVANPFAAAALQASVAIPLTFIVAALSRRFLELPFLRLKDRFAPPEPPAQRARRTAGAVGGA